MRRSLTIRLNLVTILFTVLISVILVTAGGSMITRQEELNAGIRARVAAIELGKRVERLLSFELELDDFSGFEEQCNDVIKDDTLLESSAIFDRNGKLMYHDTRSDTHAAFVIPKNIEKDSVIHTEEGWYLIHPVQLIKGNNDAYSVVSINENAFFIKIIWPMLILILTGFTFCIFTLVVQQIFFQKVVGIPLARLVETADSIHAADPVQMAVLEMNSSEDDIGRIYGALTRLMYRLLDASNKLHKQNRDLDFTVKNRTHELEEANRKLAEDIERRKELEETLRTMAGTDNLTKLPNRSSLDERLSQILSEANRHEWLVAVFFIDLDNFKVVNDTLGHQIGDRLLVEVSQRILGSIRRSDIVARLGGDEFMVVLPDIVSPHAAGLVANKIIHKITEPFMIDGNALNINCSIGISLCPEDSSDARTLMKNADTAMYHAKNSGRGNYQFFTAGILEKVQRRLEAENKLRLGLDKRQFVLHYQPQFLTKTEELIGLEALIRWRDEDGTLIPPDCFIGIAEEIGLIIPIGAWVLEEACTQMMRWEKEGIAPQRIAINLSARQLTNGDLLQTISEILAKTGLPHSRLELEITESSLMKKTENAIWVLNEFKSMGIKLSIDDFGTGYSSFSNLRILPAHNLKIDRSFISNITESSGDAKITEAIISLARGLDLGVVAEGVETAEQLEILKKLECRKVQGFYFSKPLDTQAMSEYLRCRKK